MLKVNGNSPFLYPSTHLIFCRAAVHTFPHRITSPTILDFIGVSLGIPLNLIQLERRGLRPSSKLRDGSMLLGLDRTFVLFACSRCRVLVYGMMHD